MNTKFKELIINNEKILAINFPNYKQSIIQYIKKIEFIQNDGDLYNFIERSFKDKKSQLEEYHSQGFKSSLDLAHENKESLNLDDVSTVDSLVENQKYNYFYISCLADNFNVQVGMYYLPKKNAVIIKSTVEDALRPYNDRWLKKDKVLKYCMQSENPANLKSLIFSHKPNVKIFESLMNEEMIDIYVFINNEKGSDYTFKGVFHPCGLIDNNKSFILFKHGCENEIPYDNLDGNFISSLINSSENQDIKYNDLSFTKIRYALNTGLKKYKVSKRNTLQRKKIQLEVAYRGEQLVLQNEKKKLNDAGRKDLADLVENVTLIDNNLGYDIKSFEIDNNGSVNELFIKVLSSVNDDKYFNLNSKEFNAINVENKVKLYKVYDIFTDKPKCYIYGTNKTDKLEVNRILSFECQIGE